MGNSAAMFNAAAILEFGEAGVAQDRVEAINIMFVARRRILSLAVEALMISPK